MIYNNKEAAKSYKKSKIETFSMYGFVGICYVCILKGVGVYKSYEWLRLIGALLVYISLMINLYGRVVLQSNWSNQIRIREDHHIVTDGPFKFVRHPLYTTTILMIYGAAMCYSNYVVIILNTLIFIPVMKYRAKQEEVELVKYLEGYSDYQDNVGMLFPKRRRKA